jgi:hypothetical protein
MILSWRESFLRDAARSRLRLSRQPTIRRKRRIALKRRPAELGLYARFVTWASLFLRARDFEAGPSLAHVCQS